MRNRFFHGGEASLLTDVTSKEGDQVVITHGGAFVLQAETSTLLSATAMLRSTMAAGSRFHFDDHAVPTSK